MVDADLDVDPMYPKKRTFKKFFERSVDLGVLLDITSEELVKLLHARRRFQQRHKMNQHKAQRVSMLIKVGSYEDELVQTSKTIASCSPSILSIDEFNATCGKRLALMMKFILDSLLDLNEMVGECIKSQLEQCPDFMRLAMDNQKLSATHVALREELFGIHKELQRRHAQMAVIQGDKEQQQRGLIKNKTKMTSSTVASSFGTSLTPALVHL